jgi:hypothetical protein
LVAVTVTSKPSKHVGARRCSQPTLDKPGRLAGTSRTKG